MEQIYYQPSEYPDQVDGPMSESYVQSIASHYARIWKAEYELVQFGRGPMQRVSPEFRVAVFRPSRTNRVWRYATCGMSTLRASTPIELHLYALEHDAASIELLTMAAYYHADYAAIDLGHTVTFGRPWCDGSELTFGFVSFPYLEGPRIETLDLNDIEIRCYWMIPVTEAERNFRHSHGIEALEAKFEQAEFRYFDPLRASVV